MRKSSAKSEKGQSLVEMALTATLMLFLLLAAIDFGYAFLYWITLRDAAQEGAMYGSLHPTTTCETTLKNRVTDAAASAVINTTNLDPSLIVITRTGTNPGNSITVQVTHRYQILTPLVQEVFGGFINISTSVTNTILQNIPNDACL